MKILFISVCNGIMNTLTSILIVLMYVSGICLFINVPTASVIQIITGLVCGTVALFLRLSFTRTPGIESALESRRQK